MLRVLFQIYRDAGGLRFVFGTGYLYSAALLYAVLLDRTFQVDWPAMAMGIFPSLLGFFLATFAIVLALFGSENLAKLAAKKEGQKVSSLAKLTALIVHSSLIQIFALIIAFSLKQKGLCSQPWRPCGWQGIISDLCEDFDPWNLFYRVGFFLTLYGLILVISTLLAIFQTSQITR